jgi:hypothetical protein
MCTHIFIVFTYVHTHFFNNAQMLKIVDCYLLESNFQTLYVNALHLFANLKDKSPYLIPTATLAFYSWSEPLCTFILGAFLFYVTDVLILVIWENTTICLVATILKQMIDKQGTLVVTISDFYRIWLWNFLDTSVQKIQLFHYIYHCPKIHVFFTCQGVCWPCYWMIYLAWLQHQCMLPNDLLKECVHQLDFHPLSKLFRRQLTVRREGNNLELQQRDTRQRGTLSWLAPRWAS